METNQVITDDACNAKFSSMLKMFHSLIEKNPTPEKIKKDLLELKELAGNSNVLVMRQKEAVIARCDSYINGEYGKSKKPEHYGHSKSNGTT